MLRRLVRRVIGRLGYEVRRRPPAPAHDLPPDLTPEAARTIEKVLPYTMTSPERLYALIGAVEYVVANGVRGAIVECGVWRGGSMMCVADTLLRLGSTDRFLYLLDTFEGMPPPGEADRTFRGEPAADVMAREDPASSHVWAVAGLEEVRRNMERTGYPEDRVRYVEGPVERTVPARAPGEIAVLRLDTDWYGSTRHEMEHLYPRLAPGGVLIVDDYGYWRGARRAIDEYLEGRGDPPLLCRIDATGRIAVKPGGGDATEPRRPDRERP